MEISNLWYSFRKPKKAKIRLERIEMDIYNNLKKLGVQMESLDGKSRLNLCQNMLHMDEKQKFNFGLSSKK